MLYNEAIASHIVRETHLKPREIAESSITMHHFTRQTTTDHLLSCTDPRLKLLGAIGLLALVLSSRGFAFPLTAAALCIALCLVMGIRPGAVARRFAEPGFILVMVILLKLFLAGHSPLFSFQLCGFEIVGYGDGLREGALIASRIAAAVSIVSALCFATPFTELMAALSWLRVPREFIETALFAWRYIFVLFDDARIIHSAQKNRLGYSGCRRGLNSFGILAGSLVIKAFDNSRNVTTAMVQRGYDGAMPMLRHRPFRPVEVAASITFMVLMGIFWNI